MDIKDFILLMWRNAKYIILGLVLGACIGYAVSIIQTPIYEATTRVFISRANQQSNADLLLLSDEQLLAINLQLAKSQPVMDALATQLGSKINQNNIQVTVIPNTTIVKINVRDKDPQRATKIANLLVQTLLQQNEKFISGRFTAYEDAITAQIDENQKLLDGLQPQINQINGDSVQGQLAQVNQQIDQLQTQILGLEKDIASYPHSPSPRQLISISETQAQLSQLHSLMVLYQQVQTNLTYIGKPTQNSSSQDSPQLTALQSTLKLYQQIISTLINNREVARLISTQSKQNFIQIVAAVPPTDPVLPVPTLYLALGAFVGFVLATIAILVIYHMDDSLKSAGQIEELLGIPVLGLIFESKKIENGLVTSYDPSSTEAEAFRSLGASLEIIGAKDNVRTLMIVNAEPADAKTTIAANLAVINAQQGKQVILLDGDFKHPHLHSLFGVENQKGFAELLKDGVNLKGVGHIVKDVDGLTLISSGVVEKNSTAKLTAEKWGQLLLELQKQADLIIVDGPTVNIADAQILASRVDTVLLTIDSGYARLDSVQATLKRFQLIGTRVTGAVLNHAARHQRMDMQFFNWLKNKLYKTKKHSEVDEKIDASAISLP